MATTSPQKWRWWQYGLVLQTLLYLGKWWPTSCSMQQRLPGHIDYPHFNNPTYTALEYYGSYNYVLDSHFGHYKLPGCNPNQVWSLLYFWCSSHQNQLADTSHPHPNQWNSAHPNMVTSRYSMSHMQKWGNPSDAGVLHLSSNNGIMPETWPPIVTLKTLEARVWQTLSR